MTAMGHTGTSMGRARMTLTYNQFAATKCNYLGSHEQVTYTIICVAWIWTECRVYDGQIVQTFESCSST